MTRTLNLILLVSMVMLSYGHRDHIHLEIESKPGQIRPVLTKKLQIRCSVKSSSYRSYTKSRHTPFHNDVPQVDSLFSVNNDVIDTSPPRSTKSHGKSDLSRLLSLVVTKMNNETGVNETVASVTGCDSPVIEETFAVAVSVEGATENSTKDGELGYITLTWDRPVAEQAGHYNCEANGLNSEKHSVSIVASIEISYVEPQISDLVSYISTNEKYIFELRSKVTEVHQENKRLKQETTDLAKKKDEINIKMAQFKNYTIQTGSVACDQTALTVYFSPTFSTTPKVLLTLNTMAMSFNYQASYSYSSNQVFQSSYSLSVSNVSKNSFTFTISGLYSCSIDWIAIGI